MNRVHVLVTGVALLLAARQATACGYGMPSPAQRFVQAHCVVTGKIVAYNSSKMMLRQRPNAEALPHAVAVLKVEDMIKGDGRLTHLRIALPMHQVLPIGYEGCFFLHEQADQTVFLLSARFYDYPIQKEHNPGFAKQVEEFKKLARLLNDPKAGLASKNGEERFLTAAMLVMHYRTFQPELHVAADKTQAIDAGLSKLILRALAESDWNNNAADFRMTAWRVFGLLGVTEKDGFKPASLDRVAEAKAWLKKSEESFRITTFVRR